MCVDMVGLLSQTNALIFITLINKKENLKIFWKSGLKIGIIYEQIFFEIVLIPTTPTSLASTLVTAYHSSIFFPYCQGLLQKSVFYANTFLYSLKSIYIFCIRENFFQVLISAFIGLRLPNWISDLSTYSYYILVYTNTSESFSNVKFFLHYFIWKIFMLFITTTFLIYVNKFTLTWFL